MVSDLRDIKMPLPLVGWLCVPRMMRRIVAF